MCHLLLSFWVSVKCPDFAALSCCVFISMYASAACWLRSLYILWLDLALCIFCRCCAWCVASMHGSCLLRTSYSPYVFWLCVLYLLNVLYCTLFCCCTRYSLFSCVAILEFGFCARFGWCLCSSFLVNVFCWVFFSRCWEIEMLWKLYFLEWLSLWTSVSRVRDLLRSCRNNHYNSAILLSPL